MKQITFYMFLKQPKRDIIIKSKLLKAMYAKNKQKINKEHSRRIENMIVGLPMPAQTINSTIQEVFPDLDYIDIMSEAKYFALEYTKDEYEND